MRDRAIKAVVFDLDNTLTDFMRAKDEAIQAAIGAMIDCGLALDQATAHRRIYAIYQDEGIEYQRVFDRFLQQEHGRVDWRMLAAAVVAYRHARDGSLVLYPHAKRVLNQLLRDGYGLAVVSDAPRFEAWLRLCQLGLQHHFDHVVTYEDTGVRKPDPLPFRMALDELGVRPQEAVMIGDWPSRDVTGAGDLGIHTVWARYGDVSPPYKDPAAVAAEIPHAAAADFVVDDLAQLLDVLTLLDRRQD
ncbi:MAG: HAD-IA family hydrolase [Candidatus Krumholzibacteriia bacterium]